MTDLRLLLVCDAVGGVWVYSVELARALRPLGIEAVLAVLGPSPNALQLEQAGDIEVIDTGLPLDWLETNPGEQRRAAEALAMLAIAAEVDVVQTCSAALLADASFAQPCVAVQHSCVASWWSAVRGTPLPREFLWRRALVQQGLNAAAAVIAPSRAFAAETARIYDLRGPVIAVHNGRRPDKARALPKGDFVCTAGRLWDEGKNVATLDAAVGMLNVPIHAVGPLQGPNGANARLEHLRALGELSSERLQGMFAARPVFASAALYEPFGLTALEAAHAGCALVLSDIPTHRELWDGAAIFVAARDSGGFASAINELMSDPEQREGLGRKAKTRAQAYTPERMARGMAEIYSCVYAQHGGSEPMRVAGSA